MSLPEDITAVAAKRKRTPRKMCDCVTAMDKLLESRNTRLVTMFTATLQVLPVVASERIQNFRDGKKAVTVIPSYCPFCGKKYPKVGR